MLAHGDAHYFVDDFREDLLDEANLFIGPRSGDHVKVVEVTRKVNAVAIAEVNYLAAELLC